MGNCFSFSDDELVINLQQRSASTEMLLNIEERRRHALCLAPFIDRFGELFVALRFALFIIVVCLDRILSRGEGELLLGISIEQAHRTFILGAKENSEKRITVVAASARFTTCHSPLAD